MVTESHQDHADGKVHAHITPAKVYWGIFGALIFFTLLTVGVSYIHLGPANLVVAIAIATVKAALVVLYFMHMKYEAKFNVLVFLGSLLFMGIFLAYTMNDTEYRADVDAVNGGKIDPRTGKYAYGTPAGLVAQSESKKKRAAEKAKAMKAMQPTVGYEGAASPEPGIPLDEVGEGSVEGELEAATAEQTAGEGEANESAQEAAEGADGEPTEGGQSGEGVEDGQGPGDATPGPAGATE